MTEQENPRQNFAAPARRLSSRGAGYSAFVRVARLALPVTALVIVGIVIARLSADPDNLAITEMPKEEKTTAGQVALEGARYEGVDPKGRPYNLIAETAARGVENPDTVLLGKPKADLALDNGWVALHAEKGVYDHKTGHLYLSQDVRLFHDSGNEIVMQDINLDVRAQSAVTENPVEAQGPMGKLSAKSLRITDGGDIIIFGGPAHLTLNRLKGSKG